MKLLGKYVNKFDKKDKFFLVGYNNKGFDNDFMRNFFKQQGDNYFGSWFWAGAIDVMVLAADYLQEDMPNMVDFKLRTVAQHLGIKLDESKLHDALYDIDITKMVYEIVTTRKKNSPPQIASDAEPKAIETSQEPKNQPSSEPQAVYFRQPDGSIKLASEPNDERTSIDVEPLMKIARNAMRQQMSREEKATAILEIVKEPLTPDPVEVVTEETLREQGLLL
jgi:DNA polymerase III epsilon subunit-like protein